MLTKINKKRKSKNTHKCRVKCKTIKNGGWFWRKSVNKNIPKNYTIENLKELYEIVQNKSFESNPGDNEKKILAKILTEIKKKSKSSNELKEVSQLLLSYIRLPSESSEQHPDKNNNNEIKKQNYKKFLDMVPKLYKIYGTHPQGQTLSLEENQEYIRFRNEIIDLLHTNPVDIIEIKNMIANINTNTVKSI
jgi:hypothetical protein